eukprot:TRINITY_DN60819_c0_g1_i1.p1 TRINITY_DN60819_c0_g1~~TRINITY_DN60819_c0_g1_i1.p1  ORF type:complete len:309 (-),score=32.80 TRINITY_DN60819_c0_g1_i1:78-1004(-)
MAFHCKRWTLANTMPLCFVLWVVGCVWFLYLAFHIVPVLQLLQRPGTSRDEMLFQRGARQTVISHCVIGLFLYCFAKAVFTNPGSVPETPEWMPALRQDSSSSSGDGESMMYEVKSSGAPRFCKWCQSFKPDRAHHCRTCRSCILRMDHHCPWIANCVGFHNHKYFFLTLVYAFATCVFVVWTMRDSLERVLIQETSVYVRFFIVFEMTMCSILSLVLGAFGSIHTWLMLRATTTIEFCEKACKWNDSSASIYGTGFCGNIRAILGPCMLFWFLPVCFPTGDGLSFAVSDGVLQKRRSLGSRSGSCDF